MAEEEEGNKICVVKIQRSLAQSNPETGPSVLIYDEDKTYQYQGPMPRELNDMMGDRDKIYCMAEMIPDVNEKLEKLGTFQFGIGQEVEAPSW